MDYKFTVALTFGADEQIDAAELAERIDDAVCDRVDGWYSVDVERIDDLPPAFSANDDYVAMVMNHLARVNPNDAATEIWDDGAVVDLANYLAANDHEEIDLVNINNLYEMYDMLKWTGQNK